MSTTPDNLGDLIPDPDAPPQAADANDEIKNLQAERNSLFEKLARVQADFANSRRRLEADAESRAQYANSSLIKTLLPVIDNFERAMNVDAAKADAASILKGLDLVYQQFRSVPKSQNVEVIAPQPGTAFDPQQHEALMQQENAEYSEPSVVQLLQNGYTMHGRTLRPAQVIVSK